MEHKHEWQFCTQLREDEVFTQIDTTAVGGDSITKNTQLVKKKDAYKLLFMCGCGEVRIAEVSYGSISEGYNNTSFKIR